MVLIGVPAVIHFTHGWFAPEIAWDFLPLLGKKEGRESSLSQICRGTWGLSESFLTKIWVRHEGQEMLSKGDLHPSEIPGLKSYLCLLCSL